MYVLVNTFLDYGRGQAEPVAGAVYGPFDSKEEAEAARDQMDFPRPDQVYVRPIHLP